MIAYVKPYHDTGNNNVAMLCQFLLFFCIVSGIVLEEYPGAPVIDVGLCATLGALICSVFYLEWLGERTSHEALKQVLGVEMATPGGPWTVFVLGAPCAWAPART